MGANFDTSEVARLAADLSAAPGRVQRRSANIVEEEAKALRDTWRNNARRTAGRHGKHYPNAITHEVRGLSAEIGPESGRPQGGMSFEFGSRNQPPHLDGTRAADVHAPRFERRAAEAIGDMGI